MYNALTGLGGSGQVNQAVAANAQVALLSATAGTALFVVGPIFNRVGPRVCLLLGGWTYPLYSGSLLCFNRMLNERNPNNPPESFQLPQEGLQFLL